MPRRIVNTHSSVTPGTTLARMRRLKQMGVQGSMAMMSASITTGIITGSVPGILASVLEPVPLLLGSASLLYLGVLFHRNQGRLHCVWDGSIIQFEEGVPPCWVDSSRLPQLPGNAVTVELADEHRGHGAFATQNIAGGTFLGTYEGEFLNLDTYYDRYQDGVSDYCIAIDDEWVIDGSTRAADRDLFSPCHINHSRQSFNVARRTIPSRRRVELYAIRDISVGEELLLNYGRTYWKTREHIERP
eukprot:jgi/Ulvmu1/4186/UM019_0165.1